MFRIIFQMSFFCKDEVQIIIGLSKLKSNLNMFIKIQNLNGKVIKFKQNFKQMNFNPYTMYCNYSSYMYPSYFICPINYIFCSSRDSSFLL